jgi:type IV pilus assembly protein PilV
MHTVNKTRTLRSKKPQSGLSLIESLVALVVLALGIMGLAGVQTRLLVETRTANSRAVAVQLIDDLANRMSLNRYAAVGQPQLPTAVFSSYRLSPTAWSATTGMTAPNPATCLGNVCTAAQLAAVDMFVWRTAVNAALPGSQVRIIQNVATAGDPRQLGIAIGWPLNERAVLGTTETTNAALTSAGVACPPNLICHIVYVQP